MTKTSDMTDAQLSKAARDYDNVQNEGYRDGYNPYRKELVRRENAARAARPKTLHETADALRRAIERSDHSRARETGSYDDKTIALMADLKGVEAQIATEADAADQITFSTLVAKGWTAEATATRRDAWNSWVRHEAAKDKTGRGITYFVVQAKLKELGFTDKEMREAIRLHKKYSA